MNIFNEKLNYGAGNLMQFFKDPKKFTKQIFDRMLMKKSFVCILKSSGPEIMEDVDNFDKEVCKDMYYRFEYAFDGDYMVIEKNNYFAYRIESYLLNYDYESFVNAYTKIRYTFELLSVNRETETDKLIGEIKVIKDYVYGDTDDIFVVKATYSNNEGVMTNVEDEYLKEQLSAWFLDRIIIYCAVKNIPLI